LSSLGAPRALHPFPTRRSSDLSRLTSCTAFRPPKATDRLRACNKASDTDALLETEPAPQGAADAADAARQEHHDDDQHHAVDHQDRKSTRLNSSHVKISYAVFC